MIVYPLKSINNLADNFLVKFVFSKKATKFDEIFTVDLTLTIYMMVKILSNFVAFLENINFLKVYPANYA